MTKIYNRQHISANFCIINYKRVLFKRIENTIKQPEALWWLQSTVRRPSTVFMHVERLPRDGQPTATSVIEEEASSLPSVDQSMLLSQDKRC
jgi:hypothetical protein